MDVSSLFSQPSIQSESVRFPFGSVVFDQGGPGDVFCILQSGRLRVIKQIADAQAETVGFLYAGDHFGEGALLTGRGHRATVRAVEDSLVLRVPRDEFFRVLKKEPEIEAHLQDQVADIAYRDFTRYLKGNVQGGAIRELFRRLTREEVAEGTTVSEPGRSRGRFCLVGSGQLEVISEDGSALNLVAGDFFEDTDSSDGEQRTIRSQQDCVIYYLDKHELDSLNYAIPDLASLPEIARRLHLGSGNGRVAVSRAATGGISCAGGRDGREQRCGDEWTGIQYRG